MNSIPIQPDNFLDEGAYVGNIMDFINDDEYNEMLSVIEKVKEYAGEDADITLQLKQIFEPVLKQKEVEKSINDFEEKFIAEYKGSYIADVMNLKSEKLLKDIPNAANGRPDSIQVYNYYKKHYWDNVNFKDDGTMRNPFFFNKLKK